MLLAATLTITVLNHFAEDDAFFLPLAIAMILGYSTSGAIIASRSPGSRIGWLMITIAALFGIVGLTSELATYSYETNPGSVPFAAVFALAGNTIWILMFAAWALLILLFPTGQVPTRRWRLLPPVIVGLVALSLIGSAVMPGVMELDVSAEVQNPFGVEALRGVAEVATAIGWTGVVGCLMLSILGLALRYRRSRGEERQQIRWLAYIIATTVAVLVVDLIVALAVGSSYQNTLPANLFFYVIFGLVSLGVPAAIGVAVLRYRLFDLDLVVKKTVLYGTVTVLLSAGFLVIGALILPVLRRIVGGNDAAAIIAAVAVGLAFWPALRLSRRVADRIVYGRRATPYEVLSEFSNRVAGSYGAEDVLPRMAEILGEAVGAARATVWLRIGAELRPAAVWPVEDHQDAVRVVGDVLPAFDADAALEVRDRVELLGALAVTMPASDPIGPSRERLIRDLAAQAGLVLRNVRLIEELRASRQRLVAAQDQERRRIERNIHDGAQQQLVALAVKVRLADSVVGRDEGRAHEMLAEIQSETNDALETLRDLARGIYPPLLADKGLPAALEAQALRSPMPVQVSPDGLGRYSAEIEATVYFCALEALQNVAKYADASRVEVRLDVSEGSLRFEVHDDGRGFDRAETARGTGLQGMADRLDAIGGELRIRSEPGAGTTITGIVPVAGTT